MAQFGGNRIDLVKGSTKTLHGLGEAVLWATALAPGATVQDAPGVSPVALPQNDCIRNDEVNGGVVQTTFGAPGAAAQTALGAP